MLNVNNFDIQSLNPIFDFFSQKVNKTDWEDVKSDATIRILTAVANNKVTNATLFSYARTIVKRSVADFYRSKTRMIETENTYFNFNDGSDEEEGATVDCYAHEIVEIGYLMADVRVDFHANRSYFTPSEQTIINELLYNEDCLGMQLTSIANMLGLNKSHASRAFQKLQEVCQGQVAA